LAELQLEYAVLKAEGHVVPSAVTEEQWQQILDIQSKDEQLSFLYYLGSKEQREINDKIKKEKKKESDKDMIALRRLANEQNPNIVYGQHRNTMHLRIRKEHMHRLYNYRLMNACLFGQKLVLDMGFGNI